MSGTVYFRPVKTGKGRGGKGRGKDPCKNDEKAIVLDVECGGFSGSLPPLHVNRGRTPDNDRKQKPKVTDLPAEPFTKNKIKTPRCNIFFSNPRSPAVDTRKLRNYAIDLRPIPIFLVIAQRYCTSIKFPFKDNVKKLFYSKKDSVPKISSF